METTFIISIIEIVLGIIVLITFFAIASRLKSILKIVTNIGQLEAKKPENRFDLPCKKCGKPQNISKIQTGFIHCTECNTYTEIPR